MSHPKGRNFHPHRSLNLACHISEKHSQFILTAIDNVCLISVISRMATATGDAPLRRGTRLAAWPPQPVTRHCVAAHRATSRQVN